jgi:hypothetical protein
VRIDTLPYSNAQTQGAQRRELLRRQSPRHLEISAELILKGLRQRDPGASLATVVLGAGACTEVPLAELARASDEVALVDLDLPSMLQARSELAAASLRRRVRLVEGDISGGVSARLKRLLEKRPWPTLVLRGAQAVFDAAASCLERCEVPDPPTLETLEPAGSGLVISSLVLTQLFSYPLLDILDHVQRIAPQLLGEQERHRRYQEAARSLRLRVIRAHLHLLRSLVDTGGRIVLLSDIRGFIFDVYGTDHAAAHRRSIPLVQGPLGDLVRANFTITEEAQWEWLTDLPAKDKPGRGYEVVGYVTTPRGLKPGGF